MVLVTLSRAEKLVEKYQFNARPSLFGLCKGDSKFDIVKMLWMCVLDLFVC
jgi:hypothetical protein